MYKYIQNLWKNPSKGLGSAYKDYLISWRKEPSIVRIERPTRIDRARNLGYKAKQGFVVIRTRIKKGVTKRPAVNHARRPKRHVMLRLPVRKSKQRIAEERVNTKFKNLEVLNSYWVGDDGKHEWFEVIMVDPNHPSVFADKKRNWICKKVHTNRAARGLTSSGKKSRGLRK
jgi:large subunit ribosomal protein L15e